MALYGNDIDETTDRARGRPSLHPEDGQGRVRRARRACRAEAQGSLARRLAGFELRGPGIARQGYEIVVDGSAFGAVTSGTQTPWVKKSIGLAYLPAGRDVPGTRFEVMIRGRAVPAEVVPTPFYKRAR
jgi:aminomethyltransferase